jgi:3-hydroxy-9,10-secoandrosta-1,3,5(10)-triene-9,17-dione monooxygenase reductase component
MSDTTMAETQVAETVIDPMALRQALGAFATGVTIVTTRDPEGQPVGLTANSFNSVSLSPPLVLWSLALNSQNLDAFRKAPTWVVHILGAGQEALSSRFASRGTDKFAGLEFEDGPGGAPLLEGCAARFVCQSTFEYEGGDHAIFVGRVIDLVLSPAAPLIFHAGRYGRVVPAAGRFVPEQLEGDGDFARYFIGHMLGRAHNAAFEDVRREYRRRGLKASDYTVIASLGLGEGCTRDELMARAARGGVDLPDPSIDRLIASGHIVADGLGLHLTEVGRTVMTELVAVAQASQLRLEGRLQPEEMSMLLALLQKMSGDS